MPEFIASCSEGYADFKNISRRPSLRRREQAASQDNVLRESLLFQHECSTYLTFLLGQRVPVLGELAGNLIPGVEHSCWLLPYLDEKQD